MNNRRKNVKKPGRVLLPSTPVEVPKGTLLGFEIFDQGASQAQISPEANELILLLQRVKVKDARRRHKVLVEVGDKFKELTEEIASAVAPHWYKLARKYRADPEDDVRSSLYAADELLRTKLDDVSLERFQLDICCISLLSRNDNNVLTSSGPDLKRKICGIEPSQVLQEFFDALIQLFTQKQKKEQETDINKIKTLRHYLRTILYVLRSWQSLFSSAALGDASALGTYLGDNRFVDVLKTENTEIRYLASAILLELATGLYEELPNDDQLKSFTNLIIKRINEEENESVLQNLFCVIFNLYDRHPIRASEVVDFRNKIIPCLMKKIEKGQCRGTLLMERTQAFLTKDELGKDGALWAKFLKSMLKGASCRPKSAATGSYVEMYCSVVIELIGQETMMENFSPVVDQIVDTLYGGDAFSPRDLKPIISHEFKGGPLFAKVADGLATRFNFEKLVDPVGLARFVRLVCSTSEPEKSIVGKAFNSLMGRVCSLVSTEPTNAFLWTVIGSFADGNGLSKISCFFESKVGTDLTDFLVRRALKEISSASSEALPQPVFEALAKCSADDQFAKRLIDCEQFQDLLKSLEEAENFQQFGTILRENVPFSKTLVKAGFPVQNMLALDPLLSKEIIKALLLTGDLTITVELLSNETDEILDVVSSLSAQAWPPLDNTPLVDAVACFTAKHQLFPQWARLVYHCSDDVQRSHISRFAATQLNRETESYQGLTAHFIEKSRNASSDPVIVRLCASLSDHFRSTLRPQIPTCFLCKSRLRATYAQRPSFPLSAVTSFLLETLCKIFPEGHSLHAKPDNAFMRLLQDCVVCASWVRHRSDQGLPDYHTKRLQRLYELFEGGEADIWRLFAWADTVGDETSTYEDMFLTLRRDGWRGVTAEAEELLSGDRRDPATVGILIHYALSLSEDLSGGSDWHDCVGQVCQYFARNFLRAGRTPDCLSNVLHQACLALISGADKMQDVKIQFMAQSLRAALDSPPDIATSRCLSEAYAAVAGAAISKIDAILPALFISMPVPASITSALTDIFLNGMLDKPWPVLYASYKLAERLLEMSSEHIRLKCCEDNLKDERAKPPQVSLPECMFEHLQLVNDERENLDPLLLASQLMTCHLALMYLHHLRSSDAKASLLESLKEREFVKKAVDCVCKVLSSLDKDVEKVKFAVHFDVQVRPTLRPQELATLRNLVSTCMLLMVPKMVRSCLSHSSRADRLSFTKWASECLVPEIISHELENLKRTSEKEPLNDARISVESKTRQITVAVGSSEETQISLYIGVPERYPLDPIENISMGNLRTPEIEVWSSQFFRRLSDQGMDWYTIIAEWIKNLGKRLNGFIECPICYFVVDKFGSLPSIQCPVCKKKFHRHCLFRWFDSSLTSRCPYCRSDF